MDCELTLSEYTKGYCGPVDQESEIMNPNIDHVILTRFNLPSAGRESMVRAQEGWLQQRAVLFERYCLPSVKLQDIKDFHWIIYFDPESPDWLLEKIELWSNDGTFTPIYRAEIGHSDLISDLKAVTGGCGDVLITTNLDNDDGIAHDFVRRLQEVTVVVPRAVLYLTNGLIKQDRKLYIRKDRSNAFCSVREGWTEPACCWADWHNRLGLQMPVVEVGGAPAWLQVVHGLNVSNRVRGRRVALNGYSANFGLLISDVLAPGPRELGAEMVWKTPYRVANEMGRAVVKRIVLQVAGKNGLDRLKARLAARK